MLIITLNSFIYRWEEQKRRFYGIPYRKIYGTAVGFSVYHLLFVNWYLDFKLNKEANVLLFKLLKKVTEKKNIKNGEEAKNVSPWLSI